MTDGRNEESPDAAPAPPPPPAPMETRHRRRFVPWIVVIVVVVIVALVAASAPYWAAQLPWGGGDRALAQRLATATAAEQRDEARIARLEADARELKGAAGTTASAASLTALAGRIGALEQKQTALAQQQTALAQKQASAAGTTADVTSIAATLAALTKRLDGDETRLGQLAAQASQQGSGRLLLVALDQLRAAVQDSGPYAGPLAAVAALGHDNPDVAAALKPLAAEAASGIPSTALLAHRFTSETAPAIFRAAEAHEPAPGDGWGERILAHLSALVVIHRVDGGDPTDTAVAAAEHALAAGDLAGAVAALKPLSGAPAAAAAPWLAVAGKRLAAEAALGRLSHEVAARVAGANP